MNSSLSSSFFFFLLLLSKLYSDSNCRCIITGKLTEDQGGDISLKAPLKELFATSSILRLAPKSIRSQQFTLAKDAPVATSCNFMVQDYISFSSRALPPHTSSAGLQEAVVEFHTLSRLGRWCSQRCQSCPRSQGFTNSLPKHVTQPHWAASLIPSLSGHGAGSASSLRAAIQGHESVTTTNSTAEDVVPLR